VTVWRTLAPRSIVPEQARADDLPLGGRDVERDLLIGALGRSMREPST
jgi:hypothetical protein